MYKILHVITCMFLLVNTSHQQAVAPKEKNHQSSIGLPARGITRFLLKKVTSNGMLPHNALRFVSWDMSTFPDTPVSLGRRIDNACRKLRTMRVTIFAFQGVNAEIEKKLRRCLRRYKFTSGTRYPRIVFAYKRTRYLKTPRNSLQVTRNRESDLRKTCVWSQMLYATVAGQRMIRVESMRSKILRLLSSATRTNPVNNRRRQQESRRAVNMYRWLRYYVVSAVVSSTSTKFASKQMKECLDFMYNNVMKRRRYPLVYMQASSNASMEELNVVGDEHVFNLHQDYNITLTDSGSTNNHIWYNGFDGIITTTVRDKDFGENKPAFAALIRKRP